MQDNRSGTYLDMNDTETPKGHPHAALALSYWAAAATDKEEWKNWEVNSGSRWRPCEGVPSFSVGNQYRRRPRTININGFEVPEPMRTAPERGAPYFVGRIEWTAFSGQRVKQYIWTGNPGDRALLEAGVCHASKEAAELHLRALLSFTARQP